MTTDSFGREINYLRVSVTDRCNLRCRYCMPAQGVPERRHEEILRYEEIERVVRAAASLGVTKVRITGGEPLVRKGIVDLVRMVGRIPGIEDLAMTTNGTLLAGFARPLAEAGLRRVNVSLDSLRPERFAYITRCGRLEDVLAGLAAAEEAGLLPIRLNCVVSGGVNDDEVADIAALTFAHPWDVRFIELMPIGSEALHYGGGFVPSATVRAILVERYGALEPVPDEASAAAGPAQYARLPGARGRVGFISPLTEHFCATCNRLRLTGDGQLQLCLLSDVQVDLRTPLRSGVDDLALREIISQAIKRKPKGHTLAEAQAPGGRSMFQIGG